MTDNVVLDVLVPELFRSYLEKYGDNLDNNYGVVGSGVCAGEAYAEPLCSYVWDEVLVPYDYEIDSVSIEDSNLTVTICQYDNDDKPTNEESVTVALPEWAVLFQDKIVNYAEPEDGNVTLRNCIDALDEVVTNTK